MSELKPCPFCGNEKPKINDGLALHIQCYDCGIKTPDYFGSDITEGELIGDWNARSIDRQLAEYKAFMLGLKLSSEDEARMMDLLAKYKKAN